LCREDKIYVKEEEGYPQRIIEDGGTDTVA
jgi:hypothetical protein